MKCIVFPCTEEVLGPTGRCAKHGGTSDSVYHPAHYGGESNPYEAIKVIEAWSLGFCLGNAVKYICRAGRKVEVSTEGTAFGVTKALLEAKRLEDLKKAAWYLQREIARLEGHAAAQASSEPRSQLPNAGSGGVTGSDPSISALIADSTRNSKGPCD